MTSYPKHPARKPGWLTSLFDSPWRAVVGGVCLLGTGCALFLLLRASGDLRTLGLPDSALVRWIDDHGTARNLPAFALLTIPFLLLARGRRQRRRVVMALGAFVVVTEFCQLAIRTRYFDYLDIAGGLGGVAASWGGMELFAWRQRTRHLRRRMERVAGTMMVSKPGKAGG